MIRRFAAFAAAVPALALALVAPASAQQPRPALDIALPDSTVLTVTGPVVRATDMLAGSRMRDPLAAGFPARFHFVVELWSQGGWFNNLERRADYDVLVRFIPIEKVYEVVQIVNDRPFSLGKFQQVDDAERAIARPTRAPITAPQTKKKLYYQVNLTVAVLDVSDLDEVDRWLKGELGPAINGQRNPGTAVSRGMKDMVARLLGGEKREYEKRTRTFRVP